MSSLETPLDLSIFRFIHFNWLQQKSYFCQFHMCEICVFHVRFFLFRFLLLLSPYISSSTISVFMCVPYTNNPFIWSHHFYNESFLFMLMFVCIWIDDMVRIRRFKTFKTRTRTLTSCRYSNRIGMETIKPIELRDIWKGGWEEYTGNNK